MIDLMEPSFCRFGEELVIPIIENTATDLELKVDNETDKQVLYLY